MNNQILKSGRKLGKYQLVALLGTGLSGEVWSAVSIGVISVVALKIFRMDSITEEQVKYEYEMAVKITHPNLLKPVRIECVDGYWLMEMPLCMGRSVDGIAGFMKERHIWKLLHDVASGLSVLHENGLGHFDIKPSNILWNEERFLISDFGSCKALETCRNESLMTVDESSYRFDAPELNKGVRVSASDIWSLGATVFNLFMGCHVFNGLGGRVQQKASPIPYMRKNRPVLSELVVRCLAYDYNQRPTADEIVSISKRQLEIQLSMMEERPVKKGNKDVNTQEKMSSFWKEDMLE